MACRSCSATTNLLSQRSPASLRQFRPSRAARQLSSRRYYHPSPAHQAQDAKTTQPAPKFSSPAKPASLPKVPDDMSTSAMQAMLRKNLSGIGKSGTARQYAVYGATERLVEVLCKQAAYRIDPVLRKAGTVPETEGGEQLGEGEGIWFEKLGLQPTFSAWAQVSMLHLYLVVARLRGCDAEVFKSWESQLVDHFFHKAEARMGVEHEITSGMMRQRYLKDLFVQWRGLIMAYDEGVAKGDAVLASAVWRNLYKGSEDVDVTVVTGVVNFMRKTLAIQDKMEDESFLAALEGMGAADRLGERNLYQDILKLALEGSE
ncbi:ubiquinol-cytochrome C chaperone-domain-containing protein [Podospora aff. communis PSN243]|uniref:Ubiquinol-cytochrome C chaperone-domain-containing protein n=1 Tax=Podospora aff. communis PSN243 TaxID=3040156 RepID=A0AAV9G082_9PEZI|nr:ubiquinol-cytochrome C chaperone-domain-containing protein [Podospora aff. communis PSN243]